MEADSDIIAGWVAENILPWEGLVRNWLSRRWGHVVEVDDILQEAYCRIASLDSVDYIANGRAYFFTTVQSVVLDSLRRAKSMGARDMTDMDWSCVLDEAPLADQVIEARQELKRVVAALGGLSPVTREVIELRRLHGLSQKETARRGYMLAGTPGFLTSFEQAEAALKPYLAELKRLTADNPRQREPMAQVMQRLASLDAAQRATNELVRQGR
ncbi:hypothetical protein LTR94_030334, partial [Friedmanniomyces endolithicus]